MTTQIFKYSLLQYVHSQLLGEQLNLGILFYFPTLGKYEFRSSARIKKIKSLYKDFPASNINKYLLEFERGAAKESALGEDFNRFIESNFLTRESAPLQFSKVQTAILYSDNINLVIDHYLNLYFPDEKKDFRSNESDKAPTQINRFKSILFAKDATIEFFLKEPGIIKNDRATFKPDLLWRNGSTNLIKEVQFSDSSDDAIKDKALLLSNKLNYLSDEIRNNNYRIDLFVTPPFKTTLTHSYEVALEILNDAKVPKKIVTESELQEYSINAAREIDLHRSI